VVTFIEFATEYLVAMPCLCVFFLFISCPSWCLYIQECKTVKAVLILEYSLTVVLFNNPCLTGNYTSLDAFAYVLYFG
jgi:hypothetical protein